ncbi:hypothetical protein GCM10011374_30370 [Kocuria dechangensis]|uniref:Sec-independent protein translocase protein TatB n=1 Tax=Kocuria dechangensis TaxID=1176249 RepID=A0A917H1M9_9MICC|nr:Sec-independent protein translocase TatB [Kocuria dechangensis]GGG64625.1 hypothetical protein GCM10011374_30370 [Kocuria dechangensis]
MFGINGGEMIVLLLLALFIIGPERLPGYADQLKDLVKAAKRYASGAKTELKETFGPEIDDVDWRKYDPRQYDPRTIVREALAEADAPEPDPEELRRREVTVARESEEERRAFEDHLERKRTPAHAPEPELEPLPEQDHDAPQQLAAVGAAPGPRVTPYDGEAT